MKILEFSVEIHASKEKVWMTLWEDQTQRDWGNIIDEGMHIEGELREGHEVQFLSSENGYGVTSLVESLRPNEFISFRHQADTREFGRQKRENEWTAGTESYAVSEVDGITILTVRLDVPSQHIETFNDTHPRALNRIKELAEMS